MRHFVKCLILLMGMSAMGACSYAQEAETAPSDDIPAISLMTPERMAALITSFDEDAQVQANGIAFTVQEREVLVVHDANSNRMRIMSPIIPAALLDEELLMRMSQANFDSVLDARYAVANDLLWSTFIHPLGSLQQDDFISAIAQVVTAAETFGTTYTSGAIIFGGGDSNALHGELLKELEEAAKKKGDAI